MAVREILKMGDARLLRVAQPVLKFGGHELAALVADMQGLPALSPTRYADALDDRFVAALDIDGEARGFALAYLVRAVTPGQYRLPAVAVEDMYAPQFRGRAAMGSVVVAPVN